MWTVWARQSDGWYPLETGLTQQGATRLAQLRAEQEARFGTGATIIGLPAEQQPSDPYRDVQLTLGPRLCLGRGGACTLNAGHNGEHN